MTRVGEKPVQIGLCVPLHVVMGAVLPGPGGQARSQGWGGHGRL